MNTRKGQEQIQDKNIVLGLMLFKQIKNELLTNKLLSLQDLYLISRIQVQVMASTMQNVKADKLSAELRAL